jgi:hypothetical protein
LEGVVNFGEIRERVGRELAHDPGVEASRIDIRAQANDALAEILGSQRWPFRERIHRQRVLQDRTLTNAQWDFVSIAQLRALDVTATPAGWSDYSWRAALLGNVVTANFGLLRAVYGDQYVIERVDYISSSTFRIWLDPRYSAPYNPKAGGGTPTGDITLSMYRYVLPNDVESVIGVMDRESDRGEIPQVSNYTERRHMLNPDDTGNPECWMVEPKGYYETATLLSAPAPNWAGSPPPHPKSPTNTLTAAGSDAAGVLTLGVRYSYCIAWFYAGMESGPGPVVQFTPAVVGGVTQDTITLSNLDALDALYGRIRIVYRRAGEGPWRRHDLITDSTATTYVDNRTVNYQLDPTNADAHWNDHPGDYKWIRFWPRPDSDRTYEINYLARPRRMFNDQDEPEIPVEYQPAIIHKCVMELAARHEGNALRRHHEQRYGEVMQMMRRRYLDGDGALRVKSSAGVGPYRDRVNRVTWTG